MPRICLEGVRPTYTWWNQWRKMTGFFLTTRNAVSPSSGILEKTKAVVQKPLGPLRYHSAGSVQQLYFQPTERGAHGVHVKRARQSEQTTTAAAPTSTQNSGGTLFFSFPPFPLFPFPPFSSFF